MFTNENALREQGGKASNYGLNYTKKFPPYGKKLDQLRRTGLIPTNRVIVSTCWKLGRTYPRIVIPKNTEPAQFNFAYLAGLSVHIVHHDEEPSLVRNLIHEILKIEPKVLTVANFDLAKQNFSGNAAFTLIYPESLEALYAS
tara:strand:+ start:149 stop:577 length:429 start_codon:yes stop_codon:yes gene_type:complete